ncbi:hypothetical protein MMC08_004309 [Hypocenomyce scalaris]|nr:hypothetical protein [Hypocenomyce scalaris]
MTDLRASPVPAASNAPSLLPSALPKEDSRATPQDIHQAPSPEPILPEPESTPPPPSHPPDFSPFFTLVEDTNTGEHYHPSVHYIFSDDHDNELITEAALHVLETTHAASPPAGGGLQEPRDGESTRTDERYVLLDLDATGTKIASAQSMTPAFQILNADMTTAPTWDGDGVAAEGGAPGGAGLMLKIAGTEGVGFGEGGLGLEPLVEMYEKRLGELRKVIERGKERGG